MTHGGVEELLGGENGGRASALHDGGQGRCPGGCFGGGELGLVDGRACWVTSVFFVNDNILYHALATPPRPTARPPLSPSRRSPAGHNARSLPNV